MHTAKAAGGATKARLQKSEYTFKCVLRTRGEIAVSLLYNNKLSASYFVAGARVLVHIILKYAGLAGLGVVVVLDKVEMDVFLLLVRPPPR